jgi:hypothetical protein
VCVYVAFIDCNPFSSSNTGRRLAYGGAHELGQTGNCLWLAQEAERARLHQAEAEKARVAEELRVATEAEAKEERAADEEAKEERAAAEAKGKAEAEAAAAEEKVKAEAETHRLAQEAERALELLILAARALLTSSSNLALSTLLASRLLAMSWDLTLLASPPF